MLGSLEWCPLKPLENCCKSCQSIQSRQSRYNAKCLLSIGVSEGTLGTFSRYILARFWHEIKLCLEVSSGVPRSLRKLVANLANQDNQDKQDTLQTVFFLRLQKGRKGLFLAICWHVFGTKLGDVWAFRVVSLEAFGDLLQILPINTIQDDFVSMLYSKMYQKLQKTTATPSM